ncbi:MAG: hypothetical protein ACR2LJ_08735 [Acidimicrobiales bacterium]
MKPARELAVAMKVPAGWPRESPLVASGSAHASLKMSVSGRPGGASERHDVAETSATYYGALEEELVEARRGQRFLALADQRRLFAHHGRLELSTDAIVLGGWMELARSEVSHVELSFTSAYSRLSAAGFRGRTPSFGVFGSLGKPIIISVGAGSQVYLLIRPRWWSGIDDNRRWHPRLRAWLGDHPTPGSDRRGVVSPAPPMPHRAVKG